MTQQAKPNHPPQEPIASERIDAQEERKTFFMDIIENSRGRCLRLKERGERKTNMVIIPLGKLKEMAETLGIMADWSEKNP